VETIFGKVWFFKVKASTGHDFHFAAGLIQTGKDI